MHYNHHQLLLFFSPPWYNNMSLAHCYNEVCESNDILMYHILACEYDYGVPNYDDNAFRYIPMYLMRHLLISRWGYGAYISMQCLWKSHDVVVYYCGRTFHILCSVHMSNWHIMPWPPESIASACILQVIGELTQWPKSRKRTVDKKSNF